MQRPNSVPNVIAAARAGVQEGGLRRPANKDVPAAAQRPGPPKKAFGPPKGARGEPSAAVAEALRWKKAAAEARSAFKMAKEAEQSAQKDKRQLERVMEKQKEQLKELKEAARPASRNSQNTALVDLRKQVAALQKQLRAAQFEKSKADADGTALEERRQAEFQAELAEQRGLWEADTDSSAQLERLRGQLGSSKAKLKEYRGRFDEMLKTMEKLGHEKRELEVAAEQAAEANLAGPMQVPTMTAPPVPAPAPAGESTALLQADLDQAVREPTTWTILQKMTLITSDCGATRSPRIKWP